VASMTKKDFGEGLPVARGSHSKHRLSLGRSSIPLCCKNSFSRIGKPQTIFYDD
jgi:hypothetical protein